LGWNKGSEERYGIADDAGLLVAAILIKIALVVDVDD
jgi:hypothetical protein